MGKNFSSHWQKGQQQGRVGENLDSVGRENTVTRKQQLNQWPHDRNRSTKQQNTAGPWECVLPHWIYLLIYRPRSTECSIRWLCDLGRRQVQGPTVSPKRTLSYCSPAYIGMRWRRMQTTTARSFSQQ